MPSLSLLHLKQYRVTHCYNFCVYVLAVKQCDTSVVFSSSFFVLNIFMFNTRVLYLSSLFSIHASYTCRLFSQNTCPMLVVFVLITRALYLSSLFSIHVSNTCQSLFSTHVSYCIIVVFILNTRVLYLSSLSLFSLRCNSAFVAEPDLSGVGIFCRSRHFNHYKEKYNICDWVDLAPW